MLDRDALKAFRAGALNPAHPVTRGTAQNPDIYFQTREASNKFYDAIPDMVADAMEEISEDHGPRPTSRSPTTVLRSLRSTWS